MKTLFRSVFLLSVFVFFAACNRGPSEEEINKYLDAVAKQENDVLLKLNDLIDAYDAYNNDSGEIEKAYNAVYKQLKQSKDSINNLKVFNDDDILKPSALRFFEQIKSLLDNEHKRIVELYKLPAEKFQDKEEKELEQLRDLANQKSDTIMTQAENAYQLFEDKYTK